MRVALVHDYINQKGGAERVLEQLCLLFPNAPIFTLFFDPLQLTETMRNREINTTWINKLPRRFKNSKIFLPFFPTAIEQLDFSDYDFVISSSTAFAKGIITNSNVTHISYCHSPMRYAWDWTHEYLKEQGFGRIKMALSRVFLNYLRVWDRISAERVDYWIANSNVTQKRIKKYYRVDSEVIYPPVSVSRFKPKAKKEDYFLIVSRLSPYKKIDLAIMAFNELKLPLVIIGEGRDKKRLQKLSSKNIEFLGYQSDQATTAYFENAKAFIFPGEEDFGITPVEAMAAGTPVIAYGKGGVLESVIPGITGEFFYTPTKDALKSVVQNFLNNSYNHRKIRAQAEKFDSSVFDENIINFVNNVFK